MGKHGWLLAVTLYGGSIAASWAGEASLIVYALAETDELVICNHCEQPHSEHTTPVPSSLHLELPQQLPYAQEVAHIANAIHLEQALLHAIILTESGYRPQAVSAKGAQGLMQVMPATAHQFTNTPIDRLTTSEQIEVGARYLQKMLQMFAGNLQLALAAYNAGPASVKKYQGRIPPYAETQRYVPTVMHYYAQLKPRFAITEPAAL